jgi:hypothetical protein
MEGWLTVVAALGGAVVGAGITWIGQWFRDRAQFRVRWDEARLAAYGQFLAAMYETFNVIDNFLPLTKRTNMFSAFALARTGVLQTLLNVQKLVVDAQSPVLLLGSAEAIEASYGFLEILEEAATVIQEGDRRQTLPPHIREALAKARQQFVRTIRAELAVPAPDAVAELEVARIAKRGSPPHESPSFSVTPPAIASD